MAVDPGVQPLHAPGVGLTALVPAADPPPGSPTPASLVERLSAHELLRDLEPAALETLAGLVESRTIADGELLLRRGATDDCVYLLLEGRLRVSSRDHRGREIRVAELGAGAIAGELALLSGLPRSATVVAGSGGVVARLGRRDFQRFREQHPAAGAELTERLRRRQARNRMALALRTSPLFATLPAELLDDLEAELEPLRLRGGEPLFQAGEPGDSLFLVIYGRLRVIGERDRLAEVLLAELGSGDTVGEMAIISGEPRAATVVAVRDSSLARLSRAAFERLLARHPLELAQQMAVRLAERLRGMNRSDPRVAGSTSLTLIPAAADSVVREFTAELHAALDRLGPSLLLDPDRDGGDVSGVAGDDREAGLVDWLGQQELEHQSLVYRAGATPSRWSQICLRQADRLLIVGAAGADPAPGPLERTLDHGSARSRPRSALILLQPKRADHRGSTTAAWTAVRQVERCFHVRSSRREDTERLARWLIGRAVGVVLGGGLARSCAHLGVLRALEDLGIPVDAVGGAGLGAVIAARYALDDDPRALARELGPACRAALRDRTFPFLSVQSGRKFSAMVRGWFGELRIEDLPRPFFCVSANLNRAELVVHDRGPLAKAVLASSRAPGLFPPIVYDGELHVDGGVLNNVPVDVMKNFLGGGTVIGVDVAPPRELHRTTDYGERVGGWQALRQRLRRRPLPGMLAIAMRTLEFGGLAYLREKVALADLYLRPPVDRFERDDFGAAAALAEAAYAYAKPELARFWDGAGRASDRPAASVAAAASA